MEQILSNAYHEVLRFEEGDEVMHGIRKFAKKQGMASAWFWAIGAAMLVELGSYDHNQKDHFRKTFEEDLELVQLCGNVATLEGKVALHAHGTFSSSDFQTIGGHVFQIVTGPAVEVFFHKIDDPLMRRFDEETQLNLLCRTDSERS